MHKTKQFHYCNWEWINKWWLHGKNCHRLFQAKYSSWLRSVFPTGELIKPGDTKCVVNEGMPTYRRPYEKGRLIIHFSVRTLAMRTFSFIICVLLLCVNGNLWKPHTHSHHPAVANPTLATPSTPSRPNPAPSFCVNSPSCFVSLHQ